MKTVSYEQYGDRDVMRLIETDMPSPSAGELRVKIHAASINPVDGKVRRGELKLVAGGHFPKRPGLDFVGVVDALGEGVSSFAIGQRVYGVSKSMSDGVMGEYAVVNAGTVAHAPTQLDDTTAAGVPIVAIAALQSLRDTAKVKAGDRVLVNGCTGGVGLFALQLAKAMRAHVTGVCSTEAVELARQFGADEVIDYRKQPLSERAERYHVILELSGKLSFERAHALLDEHGIYVDFSPTPGALIGNTLANPFRSHKHVFAMSAGKTADLQHLAKLLDNGELRPPPVQSFPLEQFREAYELAERGGVVGKVVIRVV